MNYNYDNIRTICRSTVHTFVLTPMLHMYMTFYREHSTDTIKIGHTSMLWKLWLFLPHAPNLPHLHHSNQWKISFELKETLVHILSLSLPLITNKKLHTQGNLSTSSTSTTRQCPDFRGNLLKWGTQTEEWTYCLI